MVRADTHAVMAGLGIGLLASQHNQSDASRDLVARHEHSSLEQQQVERRAACEFGRQPVLPPGVAVNLPPNIR